MKKKKFYASRIFFVFIHYKLLFWWEFRCWQCLLCGCFVKTDVRKLKKFSWSMCFWNAYELLWISFGDLNGFFLLSHHDAIEDEVGNVWWVKEQKKFDGSKMNCWRKWKYFEEVFQPLGTFKNDVRCICDFYLFPSLSGFVWFPTR